MIGLSPLSTGHPRIFQHSLVGPSAPFHRGFGLPMDRSPSFGSAARHWSRCSHSLSLRLRLRLNLAPRGNSQAHYAKGMRSPSRAPAVWGRMISGSVSLPSKGFFSPFPHGTCALSVGSGIQPCGMGSADSDGVSRVPPYLGSSCAIRGYGHGAVTLSGAPFQKPALASLGASWSPATPADESAGLGSSAFARHYLRNLC